MTTRALHPRSPIILLLACSVAWSCGTSDDATGNAGAAGTGAVSGATGGAAGATGGTGGSSAGQGGSAAGSTGGAAGSTGGSAGGAGVAGSTGGAAGSVGGAAGSTGGAAGSGQLWDPAQPGPFAVENVDATVYASAAGTSFTTRCFVPVGPGAFPLVTVAHGFQLPGSQYYTSAIHLAAFGFVVCVPDYPAGMISPNHAKNAQEIVATIDWALSSASPIAAKVDGDHIGATGHSLGGKVSVLAASIDARIVAVLGLDPVDSATMCNPTDCPDASDRLPLAIPTGFLGETTDASGGFQPCAPSADNFETFYASASSPSIKVHIDGANHMSFLDDPDSCGLTCSFCQTPTRGHDEVIALTRSYLAAFFLRYLAGDDRYDDYLTGPTAQQRYVQTGIAQVEAK